MTTIRHYRVLHNRKPPIVVWSEKVDFWFGVAGAALVIALILAFSR